MLREYRILVPLSPNGCYEDRHKGAKWDSLKGAFLSLANGYTDAGVVEGAWRDKSKLIQEPCYQFFVTIDGKSKSKLDALLWCLLPKFDQKSIYVSCGGETSFIEKANSPSEADQNWARMALELGPRWDKKFKKLQAEESELQAEETAPDWIEGPVSV